MMRAHMLRSCLQRQRGKPQAASALLLRSLARRLHTAPDNFASRNSSHSSGLHVSSPLPSSPPPPPRVIVPPAQRPLTLEELADPLAGPFLVPDPVADAIVASSRRPASSERVRSPEELAHKSRVTPMVAELKEYISLHGPMTMAEFMHQCMQHPKFGYYTSRDPSHVISDTAATTDPTSDVGPPSLRRGDFVTSPELCQIFGEMVAVWIIHTWEQLGSPKQWRLLEMGPGKGTLMADVLRTLAQFPMTVSGLTVHMCESSNTMRDAQAQKLKAVNIVREPSRQKLEPDATKSMRIEEMVNFNTVIDEMRAEVYPEDLSRSDKAATWPPPKRTSPPVHVHWHTKASEVPTDGGPILVVAQEFLDAMPVHQFQMTERGWCEKMVDIDEGEGPHHFQYVLSGEPTLASTAFLPAKLFPADATRIGDMVEVGAAGLATVEDIARRVSASGGAALFIDYGADHPHTNTLQAVQRHEFKHVLEQPGEVDLTAHIDFKAMRLMVERASAAGAFAHPLTVLPLITQHVFLRNLHVATRLEQLVSACEASATPQAQIEALIANTIRLVNPDRDQGGMGAHFKCMCIISEELKDKMVLPFNVPDDIIKQEEEDYIKEQRQRRQERTSSFLHHTNTTKTPSPSPAATKPDFAANVVEVAPASSTKRPPSSSSAASSSASSSAPADEPLQARIESRRAAARQAAEALAKTRADRQAADAAKRAELRVLQNSK